MRQLLAAVAVVSTLHTASAQDTEPSLLSIARAHIQIAESTRSESHLWGRLGGSEAERQSAHLLASQLRPADVEPVEFSTYRPVEWSLQLTTGLEFRSAIPAPFDAWMPNAGPAPIVHIAADADWSRAKGAWAFVEASADGSVARTSVRELNLYQRAVDAGAAGLVFSLPTPPGLWRSVVPVDKPFALPDDVYPTRRRPIPCFSIDSDDGALLRAAADSDAQLSVTIGYHPSMQRKGLNTVAWLAGDSAESVMLACHLDSFFAGANDDASGIAVLAGLKRALDSLPLSARKVNFWFAGLSSHHDEGAGMRAFAAESPSRMQSISTIVLLEHLDMQPGHDAPVAPGTPPLTNRRAAYTGPKGWPLIEDALPTLIADSGLMSVAPPVVRECIADLFVVCDRVQPFCLMAAPPYYHTDHDTLDKLSEAGLQRAVDFHLRLLETAGFIDRSAAPIQE